MNWQKPDTRLLRLAALMAFSLAACTQHGGQYRKDVSLTDCCDVSLSAEGKNLAGGTGNWLSKRDGSRSATDNLTRHDNLWDRLFDLYDLPPIEHEDIDRELEWFVNHPTYLDRVQTRAEPFLYSIVRQLEKHDVPGEIALLPIIESAFQPQAVSPAHAAGIWQFIPATGKRYGLKQNHSYDGRRDVYASTRAAIKYLKKLHRDFNGDWLLAIAAYNCGEGAVARAIQKNLARNKPTDFWSLDLPGETRSYVPRLLAVARLFEGADQYGIGLHHIPNEAVFKPVKVSTQLDLALAADAADISLDKLHELNPGFKHKRAELEGSYRLFIPAEKSDDFRNALYRLAQESQVSASGEDKSIAQDAVDKKPLASRGDGHSAGSESSKDAKGKAAEPARQAAHATTGLAHLHDARSEDTSGKKLSYVVQPGDTLWSIAKKHALDVDQISKWNDLSAKKGNGIKDGQRLVLWDKDAGRKLPLMSSGIRQSQSISYKIREGDSLFSISRRFGVSVADLRKINGSELDKQMQPGKSITVPKAKN